jgi:excisionase family DNA binding protein
MQEPPDKLLVTVTEAGHILSTGRSTIYKLISEGRLAKVKLGKGRAAGVRIRVADLERFAAETQ